MGHLGCGDYPEGCVCSDCPIPHPQQGAGPQEWLYTGWSRD